MERGLKPSLAWIGKFSTALKKKRYILLAAFGCPFMPGNEIYSTIAVDRVNVGWISIRF